MTDLAPDVVETPSTSLEADASLDPSGAGAPRTLADPEAKAPSLRETIAEAVKETDKAAEPDKDEKAAEKPVKTDAGPDAKDGEKGAERAPDGKFTAKDKAEASDIAAKDANTDVGAKPEAKANGHIEAPAKFLPDAKEKWINTPRAVQRDVENLTREHEAELAKHREASERYEPIRQFDEIVRQNGRAGLHETLAEVAQVSDLMEKNPFAALNHMLLNHGPRKSDGQPISLFELAQTVVQMGPQGYQQAVAKQPQQSQNDNPRIQQLEQTIARMQEQQLASTVIEPFKASHPRYTELQGDIAFFLQSAKIPTSLSPHDRLEAAYDMAVRINPASQSPAAEPQADPDPGSRAASDLSGSKSIRSAPGAVSPDMEPDRGGSTRDIIRAELKRAKVS